MKRSTTPALRDKGITVKSQANLKLPSQLKILNKQVKKNIITKNISNNHQSSYTEKSTYEGSFMERKKQPLSFIEKTTRQIAEQKNNGDFNQICNKKVNRFKNYLDEQNNPQISNEKQEGLTNYLISKCWSNSNTILSPQINQEMKKLVTEWVIQFSHYMKLKRETLYHTMWIMERCLQKITDLNPKNLQLLAITALFISTKYEEIYPPHVIALIEKTFNSYNKKQVIDLQQKILIALNFQLTSPNRYTFLNLNTNSNSQYLKEYDSKPNNMTTNSKQNENQLNHHPNQKRFTDFLHYLLELTLLNSFPSTYSEKQIADAVIYLANKVMKRKENICLNDDWLYLTKIQQIAYEIIQIWKENQYSIVSFLYDCDKWSFVGGLTILF